MPVSELQPHTEARSRRSWCEQQAPRPPSGSQGRGAGGWGRTSTWNLSCSHFAGTLAALQKECNLIFSLHLTGKLCILN